MKEVKWKATMQYGLMRGYLDFDDWDSRTRAVNEWLALGGEVLLKVTPKDCKLEFERLMGLPCPRPVNPIESGPYSRRVVIEAWAQHLKHEADKELDRELELQVVRIRQKVDLLEKIDAGKFTSEELDDILEQVRKEDAEMGDTEQMYIVMNAYASRFRELDEIGWEGCNSGKRTGGGKAERLGATKRGAQSPVGAKNIFRSPSPNSRSPLKSPIRPVAETIRDALPEAEPPQREEPKQVPPATTEKQQQQKMREMKEELESTEKTVQLEMEKKKASTVQHKHVPVKMVEEAASREKSVEQPPAKKRKTIAEEPPVSSGGKKKSTSAEKKKESNDTLSVAASESSRMSDSSSVLGKADSVFASTAPTIAGSQSVEINTDISIRHLLNPPSIKHDKKPARRVLKKSAESTESVGPHRATQTGRVEFEREDIVFVDCIDSGHVFQRSVKIEDERKTKIEEWSDEDELSLEKLAAKKWTSGVSPGREGVQTEKESSKETGSGSREHNFDVLVVYEVDHWIAEGYSKKSGWEMVRTESDLQQSPVKRRKEEKGTRGVGTEKDEIKRALLGAWNVVSNGHDAHIFANPVTEEIEEGYSKVVKKRMDLATLRKEIESGAVLSWLDMKYKLMLMFANAVMYNSTEHFVNSTSKKLAEETIENARIMFVETLKNRASMGHGRRSKQLQKNKIASAEPPARTVKASFPPKSGKREISWKPATQQRQRFNI